MKALRPLLTFGGCIALLATAPVRAETAQTAAARTFDVVGSAPQVCVLDRGRIEPGGLINIAGLDGDTLQILQLTDPSTLAARAASATVSFEAVCNFPHQVRLESQNNGLWPTDGRMTSDIEGFAFALPYQARITWGNATGALDADAKVRRLVERSFSIDRAEAGNLQLRLEIQPGASNTRNNAPVLASGYGDTLRIYLEPR